MYICISSSKNIESTAQDILNHSIKISGPVYSISERSVAGVLLYLFAILPPTLIVPFTTKGGARQLKARDGSKSIFYSSHQMMK